VRSVDISLYAEAYNFLQPVCPTSAFLARFCLPFCAAVALLDGEVVPASFSARQLKRADLRQFMERVKVHEDPALTATFPAKWSSAVVLELADGTRHATRIEVPKGDPANPLAPEDLTAKFLRSVGGILGPRAAQRMLEGCLGVEKLARVARLFQA
jgi:2-methylcitrate dehydratase PrpD